MYTLFENKILFGVSWVFINHVGNTAHKYYI